MKARLTVIKGQEDWLYWLLPDGTPVARVLRAEFEHAVKEDS